MKRGTKEDMMKRGTKVRGDDEDRNERRYDEERNSQKPKHGPGLCISAMDQYAPPGRLL